MESVILVGRKKTATSRRRQEMELGPFLSLTHLLKHFRSLSHSKIPKKVGISVGRIQEEGESFANWTSSSCFRLFWCSPEFRFKCFVSVVYELKLINIHELIHEQLVKTLPQIKKK